jgi:hypothetical protein
MIDRIAYRETLRGLTDDELTKIALTIHEDCLRTSTPQSPVWGEWDDVTAECGRRGILQSLEKRRQEQHERKRWRETETVREFLDRAKQRDAARKS